MDIRDKKGLTAAAEQALSKAGYDPRLLALIHTGAALGVSFILTLISYFLTRQIDTTGGLAGMGVRSVLSTAQAMLSIGSAVIMPFWEIGFFAAAIRMARQQPNGPDTLLSGFRRFGPVLRLTLLRAILIGFIGFLCLQISSGIFLMTPFSNPLMEATEALMAQGTPVIDDALIQSLMPHMVPMYWIFGILFCVIAIPVLYRFRMADFVMMDDKPIGALRALGASHKMMRYNRFSLFKLDLQFWWFYALQLLSLGLCYGDQLLPAMGISLPINGDTAFFLFFGIHLVCQLVLAWFAQSRVQTTYACAYEALLPEYLDPEPPVMKNLPWDHLPQ